MLYFFCLIHFISIFLIYYSPLFRFLLIYEFIFYFVFHNKIKPLVVMTIISLIMGLLNLTSVNGKILLHIGIFKISQYGLDKALNVFCIIFTLFLFTKNFFKHKYFTVKNNGLLSLSLYYYSSLVDKCSSGLNVKNIENDLKSVYNGSVPQENVQKAQHLSKTFIRYNIGYMIFAAAIFCIKLIKFT